jgi:DNA processing protein
VSDLRYWVGFNRAKGIGPARLRALIQHFGDVEAAWKAPAEALRQTGLDERTLNSLLMTRNTCDLDEALAAIERVGARVVLFTDNEYPPLLRQISDPPPLLYVKGTLEKADHRAIAIVGTRLATDYGKTMAQQIAATLAQVGLTIVSGLARGIDIAAHQAALKAGGRTIAVLPCGIDRVYPPEHRSIADQIIANGALIGELALGTPPEKGNFAPRNRLVTGLSLGVVVVEAGEKSGALISADQALEQGREVFAVPGNALSKTSRGTNALIQAGARMTTGAADILDELGLSNLPTPAKPVAQSTPPAPAYVPADDSEAAVLRCLSAEPQHVNDLAQRCGLPVAQVSGTLTILELKGLIRQVGPMEYVIVDPGSALL